MSCPPWSPQETAGSDKQGDLAIWGGRCRDIAKIRNRQVWRRESWSLRGERPCRTRVAASPLSRLPAAHPPTPAHGSPPLVCRSRAPAAGSPLETRGREPPSHHPGQRHLCHPPSLSQQPHEPDQKPAGTTQQQCQQPLYPLCKSPPQGAEEQGREGWGLQAGTWAGAAGQRREGCMVLFHCTQIPPASSPSRSRGPASFPGCQGRWVGGAEAPGEEVAGRAGTCSIGICPPGGGRQTTEREAAEGTGEVLLKETAGCG